MYRLARGRLAARAGSVRDARLDPAVDDQAIARQVRQDAIPAVGESARDFDVEVEGGVVKLLGSVGSAKVADELIARVADVQGVRDVAAMIRVTAERAPR
jgi:osmotically-inducible protein OsmY